VAFEFGTAPGGSTRNAGGTREELTYYVDEEELQKEPQAAGGRT
jgi:hypothetical protein